MENMEIKVNEYQVPEAISFNYEEIKAALQKKMDEYASCVYTDDTVKEAKADRAYLNNLKKTINAKRLELEREYNKPFSEFKAKINEIIGIIDKPIEIIDSRVKEFEAEQKEKRRAEVVAYIAENTENAELFDLAWDNAWLNASTSMKKVREAISELDDRFTRELAILRDISEYSFEAIEKYKQTLDLTAALEETKRLAAQAKRKAEFEAKKAEEKEELPFEPEQPVFIPPISEGFLPFDDAPVVAKNDEPVASAEEVKLRLWISPGEKSRLFNLLQSNHFVFEEL